MEHSSRVIPIPCPDAQFEAECPRARATNIASQRSACLLGRPDDSEDAYSAPGDGEFASWRRKRTASSVFKKTARDVRCLNQETPTPRGPPSKPDRRARILASRNFATQTIKVRWRIRESAQSVYQSFQGRTQILVIVEDCAKHYLRAVTISLPIPGCSVRAGELQEPNDQAG